MSGPNTGASYTPISGITVSGGVVPVETAVVSRSRSATAPVEDSVIATQIDRLGGLDSFGLTAAGTITVDNSLGPATLLVQDLATGRWRWQLGTSVGPVRRFEVVPPADSADGETTRGVGGIAAKLLVKVVGAVGGDKILGAAGKFAMDRWEKRYRPSGIVWFRRDDALGATVPVQEGELEGRSLLLLHDLFGTTLSSFSDLARDTRQQLEGQYGGRVWGFDHPTIATDPATNARRLVELLGTATPPMTVDILAHGRGGLVAAALAARQSDLPFTIGTITTLGAPLAGSPIYSPAQLVALADRYTNLLSFIPDNPFTTTLDAVVAFASQLATGATSELTGLAACAAGVGGALPAGPVWRLQAGERATDGSWAARLRDDVLDQLLDGPNDLFVPVRSAAPPDSGAVLLETLPVSHRDLVRVVPADRLLAAPGPGWSAPSGPAVVAPGSPGPRQFRRRPEVTTVQKIGVRVVHGAVELCDDVVLVGHFRGMELTGAEAALDRRLRGRMATRQLARLYPEEIGDSLHLANGVSVGGTGSPMDLVVVGLGDPGELSRTLLTRTVMAGLLRFALDRVECSRAPETVTLSAVMIGLAGPAPLVVQDSVVGIVEGVAGANARLRELPDPDGRPLSARIRFGDLRIVQLHADLADVGAHVVARIGDYVVDVGGGQVVEGSKRLAPGGDGGWPPQLATDEDPGWYRIVIEGRRPEGVGRRQELRFTALGRRAMTDVLVIAPNPAVVERLVARTVGEQSRAAAMALFEQLVPVDLRNSIGTGSNIQFIVDRASAAYPWEALIPPGSDEGQGALGRRAAFLRQFAGTEGSRGHVRTGKSRVAVVIGNPPTSLVPLPAADAEAVRVGDLLERAGFELTSLHSRPDDPRWEPPNDCSGEVFEALATRDCRVLHIAGHGQMSDNPDECGVVVGPGSYLTARDIAQRSEVPELVFLNCCDLAEHVGLASNLAHAFMAAGALAVVAAGWEVDDDAAVHFAGRFYREMLGGSTFGAAVRAAREDAYRALPNGMTWAAYQCYGDPGFRLEPRRRSSVAFPEMVSPGELLRQIEVIGVRAGSVGQRGGEPTSVHRRQLLAELSTLAQRAREDEQTARWMGPPVYAALAHAASDLGDLGLAVGWYREALTAAGAAAPIAALEQLGNLEIRLAQQIDRRGGDRSQSAELAEEARHHLELALSLGATAERHSLLGSYAKKRATLALPGDDVDALIAEATASYARAAEGATDSYPVANWLQLAALREVVPAGALQALEATEAASIDPHGDFWRRATLGDNRLTRLLTGIGPVSAVGSEDDSGAGPVVAAYVNALQVRSSWRQRSSMLEHLRDLIALARPGATVPSHPEVTVVDLVDSVLRALTVWIRQNLEQEE